MKKIILYSVMCILVLYVSEKILELPYVLKTIIKVPMFTVVPILALKKMGGKFEVSNLKNTIVTAVGVFTIVMIAYLIVNQYIDFSVIQKDFENRLKITKALFVFASLYTVFINAFLEELFFRGYLFLNLRSINRRMAHIYSAALFAVYHLTIFKAWFNLPVLMLVLFGLFVGGLIFNYFAEKSKSIISPYIIHVAADLAVVLIGYQILYIA